MQERDIRYPFLRNFIIFFVMLFLAMLTALFLFDNIASAEAKPGDSGQEVVEVQYLLRSYGYVLPVDGEYGPKTTRAVKHFQRANGLLPDGIAGPITMEALTGADRINPGGNIPQTNPAGLRGMPFAPEGLTGCEEVEWYARQAGLPEWVTTVEGRVVRWCDIAYRESRWDNSAGNSCCHSWFGIHEGNIENHWSYEPFVKTHCQVFRVPDYKGISPLQKQKATCFAKVLFDMSGMKPWRL